jgi:hypothetical protein
MRENDFECFANTGVNTPETISPNWLGPRMVQVKLGTCENTRTSKRKRAF